MRSLFQKFNQWAISNVYKVRSRSKSSEIDLYWIGSGTFVSSCANNYGVQGLWVNVPL